MKLAGTRRKNRGKRLMAIVMAAVIAMSLTPAVAFATDTSLTAGSLGDIADQSQTQTQAAKKKTVYVITKIVKKIDNSTQVQTMKYDSRGLLSKQKNTQLSSQTTNTTSYTYKGSVIKTRSTSVATRTFSIKDGRWTKAESEFQNISSDSSTLIFDYDDQGRVSKGVYTLRWTDGLGDKDSRKTTYKLSYDKEDHPVKQTATTNSSDAETYKYSYEYSYDEQGNLVKQTVSSPYGSTSEKYYDNTYKGSKLAKQVITQSSSSLETTITYIYAKKKVKASMASKVEAQQWALINENLNLAIDGFEM